MEARRCKLLRVEKWNGDYRLPRMSKLKSALFLVAILLVAPCRVGSSTTSAPSRVYIFHYENVLGTSLEMKVAATSAAQSEKAEKAVLAEIDRESHILSSWDPDSEFSRWFRTMGQPVKVSPELFEVLNLFDQWRGLTHGALDASAETITRVWKRAAAEKRLPSRCGIGCRRRQRSQSPLETRPRQSDSDAYQRRAARAELVREKLYRRARR